MWVVVYRQEGELQNVFGAFRSLTEAKAFVSDDVQHTKQYYKQLLDKNVGSFDIYQAFNEGAKLVYHVTNVGRRVDTWDIVKLQKRRNV
jgi:hypothetical protein